MYEHILGHPDVLTRSPSFFFSLIFSFFVTAGKFGHDPASRLATCTKVIANIIIKRLMKKINYGDLVRTSR